MKIIPIFANQLFAFQYDGETMDELRRVLQDWNNALFLFEFLKTNKMDIPKETSEQKIAKQLMNDANEIDRILYTISKSPKRNLEEFFKPLDNQEYQFVTLSKQKGRKNYLRLYAIKIDDNCFIITGGAIKLPLHHLMEDRAHTLKELRKINRCRDFLKDNGIVDSDSFYEFLIEEL